MKTIRLLIFLSFFAWLTSCNSDDDMGMHDDPIAVQFSTGNIVTPQSRTTAAGDQWVQGDHIGIFMVKNGQSLSSANIAEGADNRQYQAQIGGSNVSGFTPVGTNTIYYPQNNSNVDFIAYYPYKSPLSTYIYPVDVSNQATPADIDVLYANTASTNSSGYNKNSGTVDLKFSHALSKLDFTLISGEGSPNLTGAKIEIQGLASTGTVDLKDGSLTTTNSNQTITANTTPDGLTSSAIMIPQTLLGTKLIVTLSDNKSKFEWTFTASEFLKGKNYKYTITIDRTGIAVTTGNITDWTGTSTPPVEGGAGIWKIGDYYPDPNVVYSSPGVVQSGTAAIGIVFWLDPNDSRHGKIVKLRNSIKDWAVYASSNKQINAIDPSNGINNMQKMAEYIANPLNNTSWNEFPLFNWIHNTINGGIADYSNDNATGIWYLPARDELEYLACAYNDKPFETWTLSSTYPSWGANNNAANTIFNSKFINAGGDSLNGNYSWSSTEDAALNACYLSFNGSELSSIGKSEFGLRSYIIAKF